MNAYELADDLESYDWYYEHEVTGSDGYTQEIKTCNTKYVWDAANMLRQQADRIAELEKGGCGNCHACLVGVMENGYPVTMQRMIVCPDCGNKRCPKASNHRHQCTGSNEPNQRGSIYNTPQTKPLSNDEIREIGDDCALKNNGILNWIDFARAIEERLGLNDI